MAQKAIIEIELANGAKAGQTLKELEQTTNRLYKELKSLTPGSEEFIKKSKDFQKVSARAGEIRNEIKGVTVGMKGFISQLAEMVPFSGKIGGLGGSFKNMTGAIGGATKGFGSMKTAIMATGLGALVLIVGSLVSWLTKTQRGMEFVAKATEAVGAIFKVLIDRSSKLVDAFKLIFSGNLKEGLSTMKESFAGIGDEIARETQLAWKLKDALFAIERAETDLIIKRAASRAQVKEYNKIAEDTTKSLREREAAAKGAIQAEQDLVAEQIATQNKRAANMLGMFELTAEKLEDIKKNGIKLEDVGLSESTEEDRKKAAEEIAKIFELQEQSLELQTTLQNKLNTIRKESSAKSAKELEDRIALQQQEAEAMKKWQDDLDKAVEETGKKEADELRKSQEEIAQIRNEGYAERMSNIDLEAEEMKIKTDMAFADRLITEQERQDQLYALEEERLQKQLDAQIAYYGAESVEARKAVNALNGFKVTKRAEDTESSKKADKTKYTEQEKAADATLSIAGNVFGGLADQYEKGSDEYKKLAFFQAQTDTAAAALAAYKSTAEIPIVGPVLAPVAAAAAVVFGQIKANQIKNTKKAERGMILRGARHSHGGIPIEAEDGEVILTRNVGKSREGLAMASELNARFGGVRFMEAGGPVNPLAARSIASQASAVMGGSTQGSFDQLVSEFRQMSQKIDTWQRTLQVVNNVQDTRKGINVINKLEQDSGF